MGIKNVVKKIGGKAGNAVAKLSTLSPEQIEKIQEEREKYLTKMPDLTDKASEELTNRLLGAGAVEIYNAYLNQIKQLYVPIDVKTEYDGQFNAKHNIRFINITKWVTDKKENHLDKLDVYKRQIIYTTEDGLVKIETTFNDETVWLSLDQMSSLFQRDKSTISRHIKNIFDEGELIKESVVANFATTASDGKTYHVDYYNLDVIISVGYRVKSKRGVQFRIWAINLIKEYMKKGFVLDDDRLKELGGGGYFKELLERIRDIRASEKVFYRQILEIYATSIDYDPTADVSIQFFKKVQNKIHYAIHGETAAEVIYHRADAEKEFMGLTTFAGNQPTLREAKIAKNYLNERELKAMGQLVSGYLDFAERQAQREQVMTMEDWVKHLDNILTVTGEQLLVGNGSVSHQQAMEKAETEYKKYKARTLSDVERDYLDAIKELENLK